MYNNILCVAVTRIPTGLPQGLTAHLWISLQTTGLTTDKGVIFDQATPISDVSWICNLRLENQ